MKTERKLVIVDDAGDPLPLPSWAAAVDANVTVHRDRAEWLKARAAGVGGSEAAIIMGASAWGSPYQLWSEKAGLVEVEDFDNDILRFGRVVEPHIASEYERLTGRKLINLGEWAIRRHPTKSCMFATHDRIIQPIDDRGPGILSIKSANVWKGVEWLEEEEPPLPYQVQFQHELACSGFAWGSFAVLIWGKGVRWIDAVRNDAFIGVLEEECEAFWRRVVEGNPPPIDGSDHTADALKRLYPKETGEVKELPPEVADWAVELERLEQEIDRAKDRKETIRNQIKALIGEASEGFVPGGPAWTYHVQSRRETVQSACEFRTLRRKGNGKKKGKAA